MGVPLFATDPGANPVYLDVNLVGTKDLIGVVTLGFGRGQP